MTLNVDTRRARVVKGFTLIELLVVLTIIAIISGALVALSIRNYQNAQLRDGAVQLSGELRQARASAQRISQDSTVELTSSTATPDPGYRVRLGSGSWTSKTLPTNIRVVAYTPASGTRFTNTAVYSAPYGEMGGSTGVTGVIWEVSSTATSRKWYLKTVGVTGKVMLSATAN